MHTQISVQHKGKEYRRNKEQQPKKHEIGKKKWKIIGVNTSVIIFNGLEIPNKRQRLPD